MVDRLVGVLDGAHVGVAQLQHIAGRVPQKGRGPPQRVSNAAEPAVGGVPLLLRARSFRGETQVLVDECSGNFAGVFRTRNNQRTPPEQVERFLAYVYGLSNQEALHTAGVLSDDFWLRRTLSKK